LDAASPQEASERLWWRRVFGAEVSDHYHKMSVEQMRAHLARAERELQAAQRFLNPNTTDEAELDVVRAVANARTSVGDALETLRLMGERGG
jgi:hypothetical protein